jgi:hypothetical protein
MPRAKSPRPNKPVDNQVITMPETASVPQIKKNPSPVSTISASSPTTDLETKIRRRAYEFYEERGYIPGFEEEDWIKAEQEILGNSENRQQSA